MNNVHYVTSILQCLYFTSLSYRVYLFILLDTPLGTFLYDSEIRLSTAILTIYPENIEIVEASKEGAVQADSVLPAGSETYIQVKVANLPTILSIKEIGETTYTIGKTVWIKVHVERLSMFSPTTNKKIHVKLRATSLNNIQYSLNM